MPSSRRERNQTARQCPALRRWFLQTFLCAQEEGVKGEGSSFPTLLAFLRYDCPVKGCSPSSSLREPGQLWHVAPPVPPFRLWQFHCLVLDSTPRRCLYISFSAAGCARCYEHDSPCIAPVRLSRAFRANVRLYNALTFGCPAVLASSRAVVQSRSASFHLSQISYQHPLQRS